MTEKELTRRALLGDHEAQQECTDKGIAIPCPFCQGDKTARRYVCGEGFVECLTCHATSSMRSNPDVSLKDWNTRPAPTVGRCRDCRFYTALGHCKVHSQEPDQHGSGAYVEMLPDDFCSYFQPKE